MIRKVLAGLCAFSLIYSCSREDEALPAVDQIVENDGVVAAFVPKVTKQDWVVSDSTGTDRPDTRAWNNSWSNGDKIGFYMIKADDDFDLDDALSTNKQYTVNTSSGAVTPYTTADQMYYPINDDHVQFIAYSPYRPADTAHEVEYNFADQHTEALKQGVDFLFRKETSDDYHKTLSTPVALSFDHQFSKVYIRLLQGNSGLSCLNATAKLTGMPASAKVNLRTLAMNTTTDLNSAITRGTIGDITPQYLSSISTATEAVFEAIVPPHTGTAYTGRTFEFTVEGEVYTHPLPNTFDFASDKAYGFVLTLQERGVPLDRYDGLSNCYIVAPGGTSVQIPITRACTIGGMAAATANGAITLETLWDDNDVIQSINPLSSGTGNARTFTVTAKPGDQGNAVVALKVSGTIYWSWHIWVSDYSGQTWTNNGFTMMDRNLGATDVSNATTELSKASRGLFYQWGRKDPFPGGSAGTAGYSQLSEFKGMPDAGDATTYVVADPSADKNGMKKGIEESIRNPTKFYSNINSIIYFWLPDIEPTLWRTSNDKKSVYDPCPEGWRSPVPTCGVLDSERNMANTPWAGLEFDVVSGANAGTPWTGRALSGAYYPFTGLRGGNGAYDVSHVDEIRIYSGGYHPEKIHGQDTMVLDMHGVDNWPIYAQVGGGAFSVRCCR